jgi:hypothetical protein
MCTGVHRKEIKLKEMVKFRGLYAALTKARGFGL